MLYVIAPRVYSFCVLNLFRLMARTNQLARKPTGYGSEEEDAPAEAEVAPAEKEGDEDTEELLEALLDDSADEEEVAPTDVKTAVQWRAAYGSGVAPAEVQWLFQQSETEKDRYRRRKSAKSGYIFKDADGKLTWKGGDTLLYDKFDRDLDAKFDRAYEVLRTEIEKKEQEGTEICLKDAVSEVLRCVPDSPPTRTMFPMFPIVLGRGLGSGLGSVNVKQEPKSEPANDRGSSKRVKVNHIQSL
jgi:hypothetical protein